MRVFLLLLIAVAAFAQNGIVVDGLLNGAQVSGQVPAAAINPGGCAAGYFPDGTYSNGVANCSQIQANQVHGLAASATTDATNAANISSGTLPAGRMPAFSGDITTIAGSVSVTATKLNGGAIPTSAALLGSNASGQLISQALSASMLPAWSRVAYLPAAGCNGTTAFSSFDLPASAAPAPTCYGTSYTFGTLDFDNAANETATFRFAIPTGLNSLDADLLWSAASASQAAKWTIQTVCIASGSDVLNPTFNTAQTIASSSTTANTLTDAAQTGITITGCSAGNEMILKVGRDVSDTSTATLSLRGVKLTAHITPQS